MDGDHARQAITAQLAGSEKLLWAGAPRQGLVFQRGDLITVPLALLWAAFFFPSVFTRLDGGLTRLAIFDALIAALLVYFVAGRFLWDAWRRRTTYYGLTDVRAIFVDEGWMPSVRSVLLIKPMEISLRESANGRGSISFGGLAWAFRLGEFLEHKLSPGYIEPAWLTFYEIEDARAVYDRFFAARSGLRSRAR
jgi:hypothetical protein